MKIVRLYDFLASNQMLLKASRLYFLIRGKGGCMSWEKDKDELTSFGFSYYTFNRYTKVLSDFDFAYRDKSKRVWTRKIDFIYKKHQLVFDQKFVSHLAENFSTLIASKHLFVATVNAFAIGNLAECFSRGTRTRKAAQEFSASRNNGRDSGLNPMIKANPDAPTPKQVGLSLEMIANKLNCSIMTAKRRTDKASTHVDWFQSCSSVKVMEGNEAKYLREVIKVRSTMHQYSNERYWKMVELGSEVFGSKFYSWAAKAQIDSDGNVVVPCVTQICYAFPKWEKHHLNWKSKWGKSEAPTASEVIRLSKRKKGNTMHSFYA
jgi:hypothetical protein